MSAGKHLILLVAAILMAIPLASPTFAQNKSSAVALGACTQAIQRKVKSDRSVSGRVQFLGNGHLKQASNAEKRVNGHGQYETGRRWVKFSYHCIYNTRSGRTSHLSVKYNSGGGGGTSASASPSLTPGQAVGAVIGLAIAGAIVSSVAKDSGSGTSDRSWWSPAAGVKCNSHQSACYKNGRFNENWTHKIYKK